YLQLRAQRRFERSEQMHEVNGRMQARSPLDRDVRWENQHRKVTRWSTFDEGRGAGFIAQFFPKWCCRIASHRRNQTITGSWHQPDAIKAAGIICASVGRRNRWSAGGLVRCQISPGGVVKVYFVLKSVNLAGDGAPGHGDDVVAVGDGLDRRPSDDDDIE